MKALIIEDNSQLSEFLKQLLSQQGWQTHFCYNCESAIDFLKDNSVDLIMLDILLPDKKGFEVLDMLSQQNEEVLHPKVLIMSGFVDRPSAFKCIPKSFKDKGLFLQKPIDEAKLSKILNDIKSSERNKERQTLFSTFFEKHLPTKPLDFYLPKDKTFDSKDLIPVIFITHLNKFTGNLKITTNTQNQKTLVDFYKGNIIQLISQSKQSFFGNLLVEHGLCLQEDIQTLLEQKTPHQPLGEKLVEKKLLNPYMLQFILKEQIKIRLSEIILSHSSFTLDISEKSQEDIQTADINFNESDFIEWLADSLKTELDEQFLNKFFLESKPKPICKISPINQALIYHKKFLQEYNSLFHKLQEGNTVEEIIPSASEKNQTLLMLYFGLLTKSIFLRDIEEEAVNLKKTEQLVDFILEQDSKNLFAVLNLPWEASPKEVQKQIPTAGFKDPSPSSPCSSRTKAERQM